MMKMSDELVTIYRFRGSAEAHIWKDRIKSEGIPCVLIHDTGYTRTFELQVREKDTEKALEILKDVPPTLIKPTKFKHRLIGLSFGCLFIALGIFRYYNNYPDKLGSYVFIVLGIICLGLFFYSLKFK